MLLLLLLLLLLVSPACSRVHCSSGTALMGLHKFVLERPSVTNEITEIFWSRSIFHSRQLSQPAARIQLSSSNIQMLYLCISICVCMCVHQIALVLAICCHNSCYLLYLFCIVAAMLCCSSYRTCCCCCYCCCSCLLLLLGLCNRTSKCENDILTASAIVDQ